MSEIVASAIISALVSLLVARAIAYKGLKISSQEIDDAIKTLQAQIREIFAERQSELSLRTALSGMAVTMDGKTVGELAQKRDVKEMRE